MRRGCVLALATVLVVAGCGGDDGGGASRTGLELALAADLDRDGDRDVAGVERDSGAAVARFGCDEEVRLLPPGPMVDAIERAGPALLVSAREGASGGAVTARAYLFSECAQRREVFRYPPEGGAPLPQGAELAADAEIRAEGTRIRVVERFTRRGEPVCCPSLERTNLYALEGNRFRRVRSNLRRLPTGPRG